MSNNQLSSIIHLKSESELHQLISDKDVLVIIDCYADWCKPCIILGKQLNVLSIEWKKSYKKKIEVCKLNVENEDFAKFVTLNKIESLPTVLFVRGHDVVEKVVGCNIEKIKITVSKLLVNN